MNYRQGQMGRIFVVTFAHGDDLLAGLTELAARENIRAAWFQLLGALGQGRLVVGPAKTELPPQPVWQEVSEAWEVLGVGNLFWEGDTPRLHLHGALGRGTGTLTGCLRQDSQVYLVIEAMVVEIAGVRAQRRRDPDLGVSLLQFED